MHLNHHFSFKTPLLLLLSAMATLQAQQTVSASQTQVVIASDSSVGAQTTPWMTVLKGSIDTTDSNSRGLVIGASTVTDLSSTDTIINSAASAGALVYEGAGIQARVLIDCTGSCNAASNTVPGANLALPGVITLDQTFHYTLQLDLSSLSKALIETAGAHSFNFYKTNLNNSRHTVLLQLRFMVDVAAFPSGLNLASISAAVGPRTMILNSIGVTEN